MIKRYVISCIIIIAAVLNIHAAVGTWKSYMAYHDIQEITANDKLVYVLSSNDLYCYNKSDKSITTFDKITNLSDGYISYIAYNKSVGKLIVVYADENIDIIDDNFNVVNISDVYSKSATDDKTINSVSIDGIYAYLSTNFGIIKVNMKDAEITDTYNIGVKTRSCAVLNNTIYTSTYNEELYIGNINDNLLDKSNWKKVTTQYSVTKIMNFKNTLFAYNASGVFTYNANTNTYHLIDNGNFSYSSLSNDKLIIGNNTAAIVYDNATDKTKVTLDGNTTYLIYDASAKAYWHNLKDGVLASSVIENNALNTTLSDIIPDSPRRNYFYSMLWNEANNTLYCSGGGINSLDRFARPGSIYSYDGNSWLNYDEDSVKAKIGITYYDINHIAVDPADNSHIFATSGGEGVFEFKDGKFVNHYDHTNSPMHSAIIDKDGTENPYYIRVDGITYDSEGNVWFLNSMTANALIEYTKDKEWKTYNNKAFFNINGNTSLNTLRNIIFDSRGLMWFVNATWVTPCLICYNPKTDEAIRYDKFVNQDGTTLEVTTVNDVAEDLENNIWLATNIGPLMLPYSEIGNDGATFTQVKIPRNDGTNYADYLLSGIGINCITIDGGNRKWFGTSSNGAYLISADNMVMKHHFLTTNSFILSNNISCIAINNKSGEVYFGTDEGLTSFMSDANKSQQTMTKDNIYAYPNPVNPDYSGLITVIGLTFNADVKILNSDGTKVAEGTSNGGMFTWDGNDKNGHRVASGIYNVVTATSEGNKGIVCKIAIIK